MTGHYIYLKLQEFWEIVIDVWTKGIFGIDISSTFVSVIIFSFFIALRHGINRFIIGYLKKKSADRKSKINDQIIEALEHPIKMIPLTIGLFFALEYLSPEGKFGIISDNMVKSLISLSIFWAAHNMVKPLDFLLLKISSEFTYAIKDWLTRLIRVLIIFMGVANILEIWGIKVAPILAGLGLFGVAVALGAQDLFKNLISGLLIIAEKRFNNGDWILVDGVVEGTVETIGFRSTVVRRFDKAPVYVPNAKLSDSAVTNFSAMTHRRIYWMIGVEYSSSIDQLRNIRDKIEEYVLNNEEFASPPEVSTFVRIDKFSESSIDIMLYCFTKTTDWGKWLIAKENLAVKIKEIVESEGVDFAFPSRKLYLDAAGEKPEIFIPKVTK
jgi:MscS family membrane protein